MSADMLSDDTLDSPYAAAGGDPAAGAPALVRRLGAAPGSHWVDAGGLDAFLARGGEQVLFFQGDAVRFPEVLDLAVVLPELRQHAGQHHGRRFEIGLVTRADEDALAARLAVVHWPSLVFLRQGRWVATVHGMLDWDVYLTHLAEVFAKPASRPPILLKPAAAGGGCH
ncbi:hydrogenase [Pseudorhodoferax sp.]|uniref:hydrogenase n=1 Tax=Pseudorhodoferax sp. TaxID=1993553 RepID=UPI002DD62047|nr:hydrogenase [Pseudorhodoferax sp.]